MFLNDIFEAGIDQELTDKKLTVAFENIRRDCSQILKFYEDLGPGHYFYHATTSRNNVIAYHGTSPRDRSPKDMPTDVHYKIIAIMEALGFVAHRGNSLFMTSNGHDAQEHYGRPYIVFPVDGFQYTWSREMKDFYIDMKKSWELQDNLHNMDPDSLGDIRWFENKFKFTNEDLKGAYFSEHEVMFVGDYYAINSTYDEELGMLMSGRSL